MPETEGYSETVELSVETCGEVMAEIIKLVSAVADSPARLQVITHLKEARMWYDEMMAGMMAEEAA